MVLVVFLARRHLSGVMFISFLVLLFGLFVSFWLPVCESACVGGLSFGFLCARFAVSLWECWT